MLAFQPGFPVGYDLGLTLLSIAIAVAVTWVGYRIALRGGRNATIGRTIAGLAVAAMHYVGMAAVEIPAAPSWHAGYVAASVIIGVPLIALALRMAVGSPTTLKHQFQAAPLYKLGIVGLHFTAMAAVTYVSDPMRMISPVAVDPDWLSVAIVAITVLIVGLGLAGSIVDHHLADRAEAEAGRPACKEPSPAARIAQRPGAAS